MAKTGSLAKELHVLRDSQKRKKKKLITGLRTQHGLCEDTDLIPGIAQWAEDLALVQATA